MVSPRNRSAMSVVLSKVTHILINLAMIFPPEQCSEFSLCCSDLISIIVRMNQEIDGYLLETKNKLTMAFSV